MKYTVPYQENVRIAPHTSMRVGGNVRYLFRPESTDDLCTLLCELSATNMPYTVIGNASNLLFPDEGIDGAIITTTGIKELYMQDGKIVASCGVSLSVLSVFAMEHSLDGLAFAFGIPGTVGGGVYMNAGAYGGEIADCFDHAVCADKDGNRVTLTKDDLQFDYRHSALMQNGLFLLYAVFDCPSGDKTEIKAVMDKNMASRKAKQPLEYPSCGSAFKRPTGYFAGALIEQAGLKGFSIGGAQVSDKHAGFVINKGNATANDVKALLAHIQRTVYEKDGVALEPEIKIL